MRRLLLACIVALLAGLWAFHVHAARSRMRALPDTTLWAWQRPERLGYIDPHRAAVAVLAETIYLGNPVRFEPRNQPVTTPPGTEYIAVVRIQGSATADNQIQEIATRIANLAANLHNKAIQIDFDATSSQRNFYRALLIDLRPRLPKDMPLSITALVSWCEGDDWLTGLPIDEAVPMFFRMGVEARNIRRDHMDVPALHQPLCRSSVGVSLDEPWPRFDRGVRLYAFAPIAWTESDYRRVLERLAQ